MECVLSDAEISARRDNQNELNDQCRVSADGTLIHMGAYVKFFPFTNEALAQNQKFWERFVVGKKVLAICGGGDFPISAIAGGGTEVVAVDNNPVACFWAELKAVALAHIGYDDFTEFNFISKKEVYGELRYALSDEAKLFFDKLTGDDASRNNFMCQIITSSGARAMCDNVPYLKSPNEYEIARRALAGFQYRVEDFADTIGNSETGNFRTIYISNILDGERRWLESYDAGASLAVSIANRLAVSGGGVVLAPFIDRFGNHGATGIAKRILVDEGGFRQSHIARQLLQPVIPRSLSCVFPYILAFEKSKS